MSRARLLRSLSGAGVALALVGGSAVLGACGPRQAAAGGMPAASSSSPVTSAAPATTTAAASPRRSSSKPPARPTSARATTTPTRSGGGVARVPVVAAYIPFSAKRKAETASYAKRHYGVASWHLRPSMVVLHFTETSTMSAARNTFAQDVPNTGELPGTCAHFIVDQDGRVYAIVPVAILCRHTIGLNDKAIGIEMVQSTSGNSAHWADQQILARHAQITSVLRLVHQLQAQWGIPTSRVIGHAMANDDPAFRDLRGWHNDHSDWQAVDVMEVRRPLAAL
ncbi:MAG: peptidoglycan recognition protein family protein [Oryzihumus sp.]